MATFHHFVATPPEDVEDSPRRFTLSKSVKLKALKAAHPLLTGWTTREYTGEEWEQQSATWLSCGADGYGEGESPLDEAALRFFSTGSTEMKVKKKKAAAKKAPAAEPQDADSPKKKKKKKNKRKKDPNAPKRGTTGFMFFSLEQRPALAVENSKLPEEEQMSFGDFGKKLGAMWKELDEEGKAPYLKKAEADKERYLKEMESYTPPAAEEGGDEEEAKPKKKRKKDPNAPKRGKTGFMFFSLEHRPALVVENDARPEGEERMSFGDFGKKLGAMWKELDEEGKAPFMKKAEADKERYLKEMESYTPPAAE